MHPLQNEREEEVKISKKKIYWVESENVDSGGEFV